MQLIPMAAGMGQSAAQNPNASVGGQGGGGLNHWDPIGNWITSKGGDPYNLYGHKDNPGALFFPSGGNTGGVPDVLPNLGPASMIPKTPGGAFQRPDMSGGRFNDMAAAGAGDLFNPAAKRPPAGPPIGHSAGGKGAPIPGGGKGAQPGQPTMPINPQLLERLRLMQGGGK